MAWYALYGYTSRNNYRAFLLGYANEGKGGMYVEPETQYQGTQTDPSETENEGILTIRKTNMEETMKLWD